MSAPTAPPCLRQSARFYAMARALARAMRWGLERGMVDTATHQAAMIEIRRLMADGMALRAQERLIEARRPIGIPVRSHYRARWYGVVVGCSTTPGLEQCVVVRITHDRNGKPVAKPNSPGRLIEIDPVWLTLTPPPKAET